IEPNGTRPISTFSPDIFSQSIEPRPMPNENTVRIRVTTLSSPYSQSFAYAGICVRYTAPRNQNHELPTSERETAGVWPKPIFIVAQDWRKIFQSIFNSGKAAGPVGILQLVK